MMQEAKEIPVGPGFLSLPDTEPQRPEGQPIFFFDGDFRTWDQVIRRAEINKAIAAFALGPSRMVIARPRMYVLRTG